MTSILRRLSEASATSLMCSGRLSSPAHRAPPAGSGANPNLVAIDHLAPEGREGFAYQLLIGERPIHLGGVEEGDAAIDGRAEQADHLVLSAAGP